MHALNKKTSALKLSQPSVADLSDLSEQESEKYRATVGPQQESGTQSRFLKKKSPSGNDVKSSAGITTEARTPAHPKTPVHPQPVQSKVPASAALRKLAEIENRHRLRYTSLAAACSFHFSQCYEEIEDPVAAAHLHFVPSLLLQKIGDRHFRERLRPEDF